ncbi:uncharacterized protein LOC130731794 isoform X2 [Lotus japonicus]|uniref:uncharacterized protein LOC130731794 isoform X2 n=1 Tax=Lotus japonicus TaxID=34305 RepID=UPI002586129D|nr:uncharacterized protein LOC130731794 isoform X2 [Lotus japonicus]
MYALRLRNPHTNPRIFIKSFYPETTYFVVPRQFEQHFGNEINDVVQLEDPIGNTFNVAYYYNQGDYRIGAGLFRLRFLHEIQTTMTVHFIYSGQCKFYIQIYDAFSREIHYNIDPRRLPPLNLIIVNPQDNDDVDDSSDDESDEEVEPAPWMEKIWKSNITSEHIYHNESMICVMSDKCSASR